jgi:hypothetical protein
MSCVTKLSSISSCQILQVKQTESNPRLAFAAYQWDYVFDWTVLKYQQSQATRRVPRDPPMNPQNDDEEALLK